MGSPPPEVVVEGVAEVVAVVSVTAADALARLPASARAAVGIPDCPGCGRAAEWDDMSGPGNEWVCHHDGHFYWWKSPWGCAGVWVHQQGDGDNPGVAHVAGACPSDGCEDW